MFKKFEVVFIKTGKNFLQNISLAIHCTYSGEVS